MAKLPSKDLIQDITTRFILTAPAEQLEGFESIMFLVEQAHWFYEDFVREQNSSLKSLGLKDFATIVFQNCPELQKHLDDIEQIMEHFKAFKKNVPVMGGILLDKTMQRVLLVKGWKNTACWGFPRGKIHSNETDSQCAVREVLEETGYDIESLLNESDYIELTLEGKRNKLYIVAGLDPDSAQFAPKCKGEIGGYAWHRVADLPCNRDEGNQTFLSEDGVKHKFFMVWPYIKPLRKWIKKHQYNNPSWDMPANGGTPEQPQRTGAVNSNGGSVAAISMHTPYYPQQVQHLLQYGQQQTGSPQHNQALQPVQLLQGMPGRNPSNGATLMQQPSSSACGSSVTKSASKRPGSNHNSFCGPLAALFSAAAAATSTAPALSSGDCLKTFTFDRQAIMQQLAVDSTARRNIMVSGK